MRLLLATIALIIVVGCSNEFDLNELHNDIPVVYALIDPADEFQYFRIERVFLDQEKGANEVAKIADSLYYEDITVKLLRGDEEFTMSRVIGADVGLPRDTGGVFATVPNILYRIATDTINPETGDGFILSIDGIHEDRAVTATTTIIARPGVSTPKDNMKVDFVLDQNFKLGWGAREGNRIYDAQLVFNFTEINNNTGQQVEIVLIWNVGSALTESPILIPGIEFYQFIGASFVVDPNIKRFIGPVSYKLTAGDSRLEDLNRIASSNLGITASGEVPNFTNISEGLGIFASKHSYTAIDLFLAGDTKELLRNGEFTKDLNFQ